MLKRVVITNYLGESVTYKIGDNMSPAHINRLPITIENLKALNTSGIWDGDNYQDPNSTVIFTIHHDKNGIVKSISATGRAGIAERSLILAECSFKESDENYVLSGATNPENRKGYIKTAVRMKNSHDVYNWYNAFDNVNGDTTLSGETSKTQLPSDYSPTYLHRFYFSITFLKPESETVSVYPMVRLASEPSGYVPYDPDSDPDTELEPEDISGLLITSIDGLGPVKGTINMVDLPTTDGGVFNSARLSTRNIVIKGLFTNATSIEDARLLSYKYFPVKKKVSILVKTDNRTVTTNGYVESNEPVIFAQGCGCQISIICENPYFNGDEIVSSFNVSESPKSIVYTGDSDTGIEMSFDLGDDPMIKKSVTSINATKLENEAISLDFSKMSSLVPNTSPTNVPYDKTFFKLRPSDSAYKYIADLPIASSGGICGFIPFENKLYFMDFTNGNRYAFENGEWIKILDIPFRCRMPGDDAYMFVFNNKIHVIFYERFNHTAGHYTWDTTDGWVAARDSQPLNIYMQGLEYEYKYKYYVGICGAVVYENEIHVFAYYGKFYSSVLVDHVKLTDGGTEVISVSNSNFKGDVLKNIAIIRSDSNRQGVQFVVQGGRIHIFGRPPGDTSKIATDAPGHYSWSPTSSTGSSWVADYPLPAPYFEKSLNSNRSYGVNAKIYVFDDMIHIFGNPQADDTTAYPDTSHYVYRDYEWVRLPDLPIGYSRSEKSFASEITDFNYVYIIGNGYSDKNYTADPNNNHLIEGDKLVVNTKKGQKSVHLLREGKEYNVLNIANKDLSWFELNRGENKFSFSAEGDESELQETVKANILYEGV